MGVPGWNDESVPFHVVLLSRRGVEGDYPHSSPTLVGRPRVGR